MHNLDENLACILQKNIWINNNFMRACHVHKHINLNMSLSWFLFEKPQTLFNFIDIKHTAFATSKITYAF